jgi:UDP-2,3-diacylglucosamine pyrophosphatase LpxH
MLETIYDTVLLSDLHLGSESSRAEEALENLQSLRFRRLILLGDIFADLDFRRLKSQHWKFLSYIRKLSNPKRAVEVVWVEGNHDCGLSQLMSHLVGVPVYREYAWNAGEQRCIAIHGHQFDKAVINDTLYLSTFACYLYLQIQKLDSRGQRLARFLDRLETRWLRLSEKVTNGALAFGRARGATRVFCGHTHEAMSAERDGIQYFNTGAWTTERPTFITIADEEIAIREYSGRTNDRYPREERGEAAAAPLGIPRRPGLLPDGDYEPAYC